MFDVNDIIDDLGLSGVLILFDDGDNNTCQFRIQDKFVYITLSTLELPIVAHELRHFWQFTSDVLEIYITPKSVIYKWHDTLIHSSEVKRLKHHELPWEKDAIEYENKWRQIYSIEPRKVG